MLITYLECLLDSLNDLFDLYESNPDAYEAYLSAKFFHDLDFFRDIIQKAIADLGN